VLLKSKLVVLRAILDKEYPLLLAIDLGDINIYLLGRIGSYNVIITYLLAKITSTISTTIIVKDIIRSFPIIRFGLIVGIIGRVLGLSLNNRINNNNNKSLGNRKDIRLGDVVISLYSKDSNTIV
jgi:hypothetical protein